MQGGDFCHPSQHSRMHYLSASQFQPLSGIHIDEQWRRLMRGVPDEPGFFWDEGHLKSRTPFGVAKEISPYESRFSLSGTIF